MAQKYVELPGIGRVLLAKRRGSHSLRLTIRSDGVVRVGLPAWAPYAAGVKFALDRKEWINSHLVKISKPQLTNGQRIGKSFRLEFRQDLSKKTVVTKVTANQVTIASPYPVSHPITQTAAVKASERALKKDAEKLLAIRLRQLAQKHGYSYKSLKIKKLRSRWGSCSSIGEITLNLYLIQLPWRLIDYVILHELVHTKHMNHSQSFWDNLEGALPLAKSLRREIHNFRPDVMVV